MIYARERTQRVGWIKYSSATPRTVLSDVVAARLLLAYRGARSGGVVFGLQIGVDCDMRAGIPWLAIRCDNAVPPPLLRILANGVPRT